MRYLISIGKVGRASSDRRVMPQHNGGEMHARRDLRQVVEVVVIQRSRSEARMRASSDIPPSLGSQPQSGYALHTSRTQRHFRIQRPQPTTAQERTLSVSVACFPAGSAAHRSCGRQWPPQTGVRPIRQENKLLNTDSVLSCAVVGCGRWMRKCRWVRDVGKA